MEQDRTTAAAASAAALRKRRSRARRADGSVLVKFEVAANATDALFRFRLLDAANRGRSDAVAAAIITLATRALRLSHA